MVVRTLALQEVRALIPGTCKCVTLHGKKAFANVIKLRFLRLEMVLDYPLGPVKSKWSF